MDELSENRGKEKKARGLGAWVSPLHFSKSLRYNYQIFFSYQQIFPAEFQGSSKNSHACNFLTAQLIELYSNSKTTLSCNTVLLMTDSF